MASEAQSDGVLAVAGWRVDNPDQKEARFPPAAADVVKSGIRRLLKAHNIDVVVASASPGADILALEAATELKRRIRIVLPVEQDLYRQSALVDGAGDWKRRFDALLNYDPTKREVVVVVPDTNVPDAGARAHRRILDDVRQLASKANVTPRALAIRDSQVSEMTDTTSDFVQQASVNGIEILNLTTRPVMAARGYMEGQADRDPEDMLDLRDDLARSEPVVASQLTRELARRFLQGKKRMSYQAVDRLWKACKDVEAFGFARRILKRRREGTADIMGEKHYKDAPGELKLRQQHALCTSKDPDLSAAMRHDWALAILDADATESKNDPEHQGIAGGIYKRRWEWDSSRASLERSLHHYRKGISEAVLIGAKPGRQSLVRADFSNSGYVEINYAFVLDLLACVGADEQANSRYKAEAQAMRTKLIAALALTDMWSCATLAEAHLGLDQFDEATDAVKQYMTQDPASWEVETTLRQLVRLAHVRGTSERARDVLAPAFGTLVTPAHKAASQSLLIGRVGLALSGGGFRASLYHLGVLARLAESEVLHHVEVLSCVSGGSIVGAHYYLCLREELTKKGEQLEPEDYVRIVKRVIEEFVAGVQHNLRTRIFAKLSGSYAAVSGDDRRYAQRVGDLLHEAFYAKVDPNGSRMHELLIQPKDAPHDFHPGRHNWTLKNKVPVLILNAATLNTGHSWQFTARSMGESPFSIQADVDSNPRLRRANYHQQIKDRSVFLRDAVAASACVPGLFAPLQLDGLYPEYEVRLVDGGVFDNLGTTSLIEQDCQVMLVSDAAGQLFGETMSTGGHFPPFLRSFGVFQERIRQTGYDNLIKRKQAGQIRGLAYVHLTQGLRRPAVNWNGCEDPLQANEQLPDDAGVRSGTGDGVDGGIQMDLARMRTDLDVFSEIECAALMASGYASMGSQLKKLELDLPPLTAPRRNEQWFFSRLLPVVGGQEHDPNAFAVLGKHLSVSSSSIGRSMRLDVGLKVVGSLVAVLVAAICGVLVYTFRHRSIATIGSVAMLSLGLLLPLVFGNWIGIVLDPRRVWREPLRKFLTAIPLTLVAKMVIKWIDPRYVERGRLAKVFGKQP